MKDDGVKYCFANWGRQEKIEIERRKRDFNNDD